MPKGIPAAGFRLRKYEATNRLPILNSGYGVNIAPVVTETDEQIDARITERFKVLAAITEAVVYGNTRALIVSGPPGVGKTFTIEKILAESGSDYSHESGFARATGLYKLLYKYSKPGNILIMDDIDDIFADEAALSLLKIACDTTKKRTISWRAETKMTDEDGLTLPTSFDFEGSMIFITNKDFDAFIERETKLAPHMAALISRSHYIDLSLRSRRDYMIRIKHVIYRDKMLYDMLNEDQINTVVAFMDKHLTELREVSLRMALKIADMMRSNSAEWESICRVTCLKG